MSSTKPGTSGTAKRGGGTAKKISYTISSSSSTSHGHRDSKRRKSKRKRRSSSSDTSSSSNSLEKRRSTKRKRVWISDSSCSSGIKKSKKRRGTQSSSSESAPKRKTKSKAKAVSESSGDTSSPGRNAMHNSSMKTLRHSSVNTLKAGKTSNQRDRDNAKDLQPPSAATVNVAASQQRVAERPLLCLSAKERSGQEALSEGTNTHSRNADERTLGYDEQNGVQKKIFRLAADQEQESSSSEDRSKKKRKSNELDDLSTEAGKKTDGGALQDTSESECSSECELEDNQAEAVEGAPEDPDLPPMEGQPPPAGPEMVAAFADLIFDIFFELLWLLIQPYVQPQIG